MMVVAFNDTNAVAYVSLTSFPLRTYRIMNHDMEKQNKLEQGKTEIGKCIGIESKVVCMSECFLSFILTNKVMGHYKATCHPLDVLLIV